MSSFISRFKVLIATALLILGTELVLAFGFKAPSEYATDFFEFAYRKPEHEQKFIIYKKLTSLVPERANIVFVGDSAARHGVQPKMVMEHTAGRKTVNLGLGQNVGFTGSWYMAKYYAERSKNVEAVVLYFTPYSLVEMAHDDRVINNSMRDNFLSVWRHVRFPNYHWRLPVTNWIYYGKWSTEFFGFREPVPTNLEHQTFDEWNRLIPEHFGWMSWPTFAGSAGGVCDFMGGNSGDSHDLEKNLSQFSAHTKNLGTKLALIFNPVACEEFGPGSDSAQAELDRFAFQHQEVLIPTDLITTWPANEHSDIHHLTYESSVKNSHRIGVILNEWLSGRPKNYYRDSFADIHSKELNGEVKSYYETGELKSIRPYRNGALHGGVKSFYPDGSLMSERHYQGGKMMGVARKFYSNGKIEFECEIQDGKLDGICKRFYPDGHVREEISYAKGKRFGKSVYYIADGKMMGQADYRNGKVGNGVSYEYYPNGNVQLEIHQWGEEKHGPTRFFDPAGLSVTEVMFNQGAQMNTTIRKTFYPSGKLKSIDRYKNQQLDGVSRVYTEDGPILSETHYKNGRRTDKIKSVN